MSRVVTLRNGAQAQVLPNGQYRFIKGASKQYLDSIRVTGVRGPNMRPSGRQPSRAYLLAKLKADKGFNRRAVRSDMSKKNNKVLDPSYPPHARIIRKAGSLNDWDVANFDHGNKADAKKPMRMRMHKPTTYRQYARPPRTAAQTAASRRNIQKARAARRVQRGAGMVADRVAQFQAKQKGAGMVADRVAQFQAKQKGAGMVADRVAQFQAKQKGAGQRVDALKAVFQPKQTGAYWEDQHAGWW